MYIKTIVYSLLFFALTPLTLVICIFTLATGNSPVKHTQSVLSATTTSSTATHTQIVPVFASLPSELAAISTTIEAKDARTEIIRQYLVRYDSPLAPHASKLVEEADKNGLDFRLLTAIAQQESNLCKKIPEGTFNCWGWGIHKRGTLGFESFEEGIEVVSNGLKENYLNKGYTTPDEIMRKYTPSSPGSWAHGVNTFIGQME